MRRKQHRFRENEARANVIQEGKELFDTIKGHWRDRYFKNQNDIVLEIGCGRGEYTIGLAQLHPGRNYLGVDIKGDRIWKGSKTAEALQLSNVAFLRTQIQVLDRFFASGEVNEIWLTFPDPRPKKSDIKRRMIHPRFIEIYKAILTPGGTVHLKTDNQVFFDYALEVLSAYPGVQNLQCSQNVYQSYLISEELKIKTHYEQLFADQGFTIKYLSFQL